MIVDKIPKSHERNRGIEEIEKQCGMKERSMDYYGILQQPEPLLLNHHNDIVENDDDVISMDPFVRTPISTPIDAHYQYTGFTWGQGQGQMQPPFPPYLKFGGRQNTATSLSSSVSDLHATKLPHSDFTPQFLRLLLEIYQNVCSDPMVTPFDTDNPPCGILNRVSKISVEESERKGIDIGYERNSWLLTLVRHRLLEEVRGESYLSRSASAVSIAPLASDWMEPTGTFEVPSPDQVFFDSHRYDFTAPLMSSNPNGKDPIRLKSSSPLLLGQSALERTKSDPNSSAMSGLTPTNSETSLSDTTNFLGNSGLLTRQAGNISLVEGQACNDTNSTSTSLISPIASIEDPSNTLRRKKELPKSRR